MAHFLCSSIPSAGHRHTECNLPRVQLGQGCWPGNKGCVPPRSPGKSWAQTRLFGFEVCWGWKAPCKWKAHSLINYNWGFVLKNDSFEINFHQTGTTTKASDNQNVLHFLSMNIFILGPEILFWSQSSLWSLSQAHFAAGFTYWGSPGNGGGLFV